MARTRDFVEVVRVKLASNPALAQAVERESFKADVATKVYEARTKAGLTQKGLAELVNLRPSVISRIENADYDRYSLSLLKKLAHAFGKKLRVDFYDSSVPSRTDVA